MEPYVGKFRDPDELDREAQKPTVEAGDSAVGSFLYNGLKAYLPVPMAQANLAVSSGLEAFGLAPEGYSKQALPRIEELEANPHTGWGMAGSFAGGAAQAVVGGAALGGWANPGQAAASKVLPGGFGKAVGLVADGALQAGYSGGIEAASQDFLQSGEVKPDHVVASVKDSAMVGGPLSLVLGGSMHLLANKGGEAAGKFGKYLERKGTLDYLERSGVKDAVGIAGSEQAAADAGARFYDIAKEKAAGGKAPPLATALDDVITQAKGEAAETLKATSSSVADRESFIRAAKQAVDDSLTTAERAERSPFLHNIAQRIGNASEPFLDRQAELKQELARIANWLNKRDELGVLKPEAQEAAKAAGKAAQEAEVAAKNAGAMRGVAQAQEGMGIVGSEAAVGADAKTGAHGPMARRGMAQPPETPQWKLKTGELKPDGTVGPQVPDSNPNVKFDPELGNAKTGDFAPAPEPPSSLHAAMRARDAAADKVAAAERALKEVPASWKEERARLESGLKGLKGELSTAQKAFDAEEKSFAKERLAYEGKLAANEEAQELYRSRGQPGKDKVYRDSAVRRIGEIQKELASLDAARDRALKPLWKEKSEGLRKLEMQYAKERKALGDAADKHLAQVQEAQRALKDLEENPKATWQELKQTAKGLQAKYPELVGDDLVARVELARTNAQVAESMRRSIRHSDGPIPFTFAGKHGSKLGALAYVMGAGGPASLGIGIGAKVIDSHFAPDSFLKAARAGNAALRVVSEKFAVDSAAANAVRALGTSFVPRAGAQVASYRANHRDRDKKVQEDMDRISGVMTNPAAHIQTVTERLEKVKLPAAYREVYAARAGAISANVAKVMPKPIVMGGPFGTMPRFADSDVMDFEEYVSVAADPHVGLAALKRGSLTMAQAKAMRENYPDIVAQVRQNLLDHTMAPMSEQGLLQLERLFGEPLVMEHSGDYVRLAQRVHDQMNRTNTPGSQGGGSPPAAQNAPHVRLNRTDSERIQER